jgi:hypothetical protein
MAKPGLAFQTQNMIQNRFINPFNIKKKKNKPDRNKIYDRTVINIIKSIIPTVRITKP